MPDQKDDQIQVNFCYYSYVADILSFTSRAIHKTFRAVALNAQG